MSHTKFFAVIAAFIGFSLAGTANAQPGLSTKPNYDAIEKADRIDENAQLSLNTLHNNAILALNAKDFATAERFLASLVSRNPSTEDANFLMGLAKTGLGKWGEARPYLEAAVQKEPLRPEPKTRLGLTYLKLNEFDAAKRQRAGLASLDAACKQSCADATWIKDGLTTLDQALAPGSAATLAAASTQPAAPLTGETTNFDPRKYNLVTFTNTADLYGLLTADGRCAPKKLAEPRQPCALILYRPAKGAKGGLTANFKPVFRIDSRGSVWAIHNKKLQKVKIEELYFDIEQIIGEEKTTYTSVAVIGNAENKANCDKGLPCLSNLVSQDMFSMYATMPPSVVKEIWGGGMQAVGTESMGKDRIRY